MTEEKKRLYKEIGNRIKLRRNDFNYTREYLAELINCNPSFLAQVENGYKGLSIENLIKASGILHCSLDYLLTGMCPDNDNEINVLLFDMLSTLNTQQLHNIYELILIFIKSTGNYADRFEE